MSGIPGDPGQVEASAATLMAMYDSVEHANSTLLAARGEALGAYGWTGSAANAFDRLVEVTSGDLIQAAALADCLSGALKSYSDELRLAQQAYAKAETRREMCLLAADPAGAIAAANAKVAAQFTAEVAVSQLLAALQSLPTPPDHPWASASIPNVSVTMADPLAMPQKGAAAGGWMPLLGALYAPGGPQLSDIQQGPVGDCYFLSSVAAMLRADPQAILNMIHDNGDGTYTVTFADGSRETVSGAEAAYVENTWKPGAFNVDTAATPTGESNVPVLWVQVLEQAYAQRQGSYNAIGQGGFAENTLSLLDPGAKTHVVDPSNPFQVIGGPGAKTLASALTAGLPVTASTKTTIDNSALAKQLNVVGDHEYYVTGYDPQTGLITLGNPWGTSASVTPKPMTWDQFRQLYDAITIGNAH